MAHTSQLRRALAITDWRSLVHGDYVTVNRAGTPIGAGWLDEVTEDGGVIWLHLAKAGGRRMFWRGEDYTLTVDVP